MSIKYTRNINIRQLSYIHYTTVTKITYLTKTDLSCSVTLLCGFLLLPNNAPITNEVVYTYVKITYITETLLNRSFLRRVPPNFSSTGTADCQFSQLVFLNCIFLRNTQLVHFS